MVSVRLTPWLKLARFRIRGLTHISTPDVHENARVCTSVRTRNVLRRRQKGQAFVVVNSILILNKNAFPVDLFLEHFSRRVTCTGGVIGWSKEIFRYEKNALNAVAVNVVISIISHDHHGHNQQQQQQ